MNIAFCAFFLCLLSGVANAAEDRREIPQPANLCLGCHGVESYTNVYPTYRVPKLASQHKDYIISALEDYKSGARKHPTMHAQASALNKEDFVAVAEYFASFPTPDKPSRHVEEVLSEKMTEQLTVCGGCHGVAGHSNLSNTPHLASQYRSYLIQTLKEYKNGTRKNAIMNEMSKNLSEDDIVRLASYYAGRPYGLPPLAIHITTRDP